MKVFQQEHDTTTPLEKIKTDCQFLKQPQTEETNQSCPITSIMK